MVCLELRSKGVEEFVVRDFEHLEWQRGVSAVSPAHSYVNHDRNRKQEDETFARYGVRRDGIFEVMEKLMKSWSLV